MARLSSRKQDTVKDTDFNSDHVEKSKASNASDLVMLDDVKAKTGVSYLRRYLWVLISLFAILILVASMVVFIELRHPATGKDSSSDASTSQGINNVSQLKAARDKLSKTVQPISSDVTQLESLK